MKLSYTVTEQDYLRFNIHHLEQSNALSKAARGNRLLFPALFALIGTFFFGFMTYKFGFRRIPFAYLAVCLTLSALWYAFYPRLHRSFVEKRLRAYIAEGNGKEYLGDCTLELLDDRLRLETPGDVTEKAYDAIRKLAEDKDCLYIYIGSIAAVIVPLRAFGSGEAYREFRRVLEEKIRAAKETDTD